MPDPTTTAEALAIYGALSPGRLETLEGLEQLRFLEHGHKVRCVEVQARGRVFWELNNPEDVPRIEQALRDMARTYAQRVKESGQEAVLDALQSYERRIIHNCLADDPDVFTYSEGEEPDRRVVISPREAAEPA